MSRRPFHGYTLAEMLAVCAILSIVAMVAIPAAQPVGEFRADAAAGEIRLALRYAREDAVRSSAWRMFGCEQQQNRVRVYGLEITGANIAASNVDPVRHPGSRGPYTVALAQVPAGSNMVLTGCSFVFADGSTATTLAFDTSGAPVRGTGNASARDQPLKAGSVRIGAGSAVRTISIDLTGRITTS